MHLIKWARELLDDITCIELHEDKELLPTRGVVGMGSIGMAEPINFSVMGSRIHHPL